MDYAVIELDDRQYTVRPGKTFAVEALKTSGRLTVDKVLLMVNDGKIELGTPYLKKSLEFEVVKEVKLPKIRVAKYHAKANYRRVKGTRSMKTQIRLITSSSSVKK